MIDLPDKLSAAYNHFMALKKVPVKHQPYFRKWLRYYVDFCRKYENGYADHLSLSKFISKLTEKQQTEAMIQQAKNAVNLYYSMLDNRQNLPAQLAISQNPSPPNDELVAATGNRATDWTWVYDKLESQICVRHYSDKTLRSYRGWVRQLQTFVHSKDATELCIDDVKDFLSYLAVKKKVSASSQNQAFNGLLFMFRHVLGKEFGKVDGVVRAKQRKNIPVVLSREEVDRVFMYLEPPYDLVVHLLYGCGLRLFECMKLRVQDFNFSTGLLTVHNGKGKKDRSVPLPIVLFERMKDQIEQVAAEQIKDCESGYAGVFLEGRLAGCRS